MGVIMSMYRYDKAGYSGEAYDRNVFEANLSTVNKIQRDFWNAKQLLRKKMGKQDDDCIVASDSEIDSKLVLFGSIQKTCTDLIRLIEMYQQRICDLSRDENSMGRFLKDQGSLDKTPAGKLMGVMGKAQCFTSQQRLTMRSSLSRLQHDIETFRLRAIGDTLLTIKNMEEARTHYRASLRWMQDISANLDPEQFKKLEKFRKVQTEVRLNKEKFDRLKWAVCQKVDLLCASRTNLFSVTLVPYQTELSKFWEKSSHCLASVLENIKDHKHYEFKLLKDLNPLTDSNEQYMKSDGAAGTLKKAAGDDELINLADMIDSKNPTDEGDFTNQSKTTQNNEADCDLLGDLLPSSSDRAKKDQDDEMLLDDLLGGGGSGEFEKQWESVFGEFKQAGDDGGSKNKNSLSLENLLIDDDDDDIYNENLIGSLSLNKETNKSAKETDKPTAAAEDSSSGSYLPSQLLDLMTSGGHQAHEAVSNTQATSGLMMMGPQSTTGGSSLLDSDVGGSQFYGMQPPSYASSIGNNQFQQQQHHQQQQQQQLVGSDASAGQLNLNQPPSRVPQTNKSAEASRAAWYDLFAELDPLQNPDNLGKRKEKQKQKQ